MMITRMNKLSMMFCTKMTKIIQKTGAYDVPQLTPYSQVGGVIMQSNMEMFQFSPVENTNIDKKL